MRERGRGMGRGKKAGFLARTFSRFVKDLVDIATSISDEKIGKVRVRERGRGMGREMGRGRGREMGRGRGRGRRRGRGRGRRLASWPGPSPGL